MELIAVIQMGQGVWFNRRLFWPVWHCQQYAAWVAAQ